MGVHCPLRPEGSHGHLPSLSRRSRHSIHYELADSCASITGYNSWRSRSGGFEQPIYCHASYRQEGTVCCDQENNGVKQTKSKRKRRMRFSKIEMESMKLLEWEKVCKQVASFARTPPAAQKAFTGKLDIGETLEDSVKLLEQTKEALRISGDLNFNGIYDVRNAMDAASRGVILHPLVIGAFATTLETVQQLICELDDPKHGETPALSEIISKHRDFIMDIDLARCIRAKINVKDGRIHDEASDTLNSIRSRKRGNFEDLSNGADEWARRMYSCGASERLQVVIRRGRRCIPIKAGRNGELPDGSVCLGTSGSGNTMYMEPAPLVPLNNIEIQLLEEEKNEEEKILKTLSQLIHTQSGKLKRILSCVTKLDLAFARAEHAKWLSGSMPQFSSRSTISDPLIECRSVMHPLLLEQCLSPLPAPKLPQKAVHVGESIYGSSLEGINLIPELWDRDSQIRTKPTITEGPDASSLAADGDVTVQPIDITIPQNKTAVIVTGPNTGGKTASLKTLGLVSLMAKSGLCIPTSEPAQEMKLCWFDKILADVGDAQSLQQNLSTFSGHVKRIKSILRDKTSKSLVLLDEIGSGTDPTEGAAFALAILDKLAHGGAAMTYATTHHAELKEVALRDETFYNANVEFDVKTLLPTYRIIWGSSGDSHALSVAEGLGFDSKVIEEARQVSSHLKAKSENNFLQMDSLKESLPNQISMIESRINASQNNIQVQKVALDDLRGTLHNLHHELKELEHEKTSSFDDISKKIDGIVKDAKGGRISVADAWRALSDIVGDARSAAEITLAEVYDDEISSSSQSDWVPSVGDDVAVLSMAGRVATVESVNIQKKRATVRAGSMVIADVSFQNLRKQDPKVKSKKSSRGPLPAPDTTPPLQQAPAIQTRQNTVDVRGESADEAVSIVQDAIGASRSSAVLFVVHGVGTGRVRARVLEFLRKAPRVQRFEQHEGSAGGCTVVYMR